MATGNGLIKGAKAAGKALVKAGGVMALVELGTSLAQQGIDAGIKAHNRKSEEKETLVKIPEMYSSDFRLKLEDATRWLEEVGLKAVAVVVQPNIAYKDCSDLEVVATNYKLKQKVRPGTHVILKYVTSEVIEASQKLFDESERQKAEKAKQKSERNAINKQKLDETVANVQHGFNDVLTNTQKGIEGLFSKKKTGLQEKDGEKGLD